MNQKKLVNLVILSLLVISCASTGESSLEKERKAKPLPEKPKTLSLAEEMRMKLSRRANIMSGRADKEEQQKSKQRRTTVLKAKVNSVNAFSKGLKGLKKAKQIMIYFL